MDKNFSECTQPESVLMYRAFMEAGQRIAAHNESALIQFTRALLFWAVETGMSEQVAHEITNAVNLIALKNLERKTPVKEK